jgi:pyrroline-5-carboxylate reductase
MTEALAKAGVAGGLAPEVAMRLARATFVGAAALAEADQAPVSTLRERVASPGGTTAAGLAEMDGIDALLDRVLRAAAERSRQLAGIVPPT